MVSNPFTPTFGVSPPLLVGRQEVIDDFTDALDDGPGAPARALLLTGVRGCGKTVLLNALEDAARERGWEVLSTTVRPGFATELGATLLPAAMRRRDPGASGQRLTGVSANLGPVGGGIEQEHLDPYPVAPSLRSQVADLGDVLDRDGVGLLISLDEVHAQARDELRELAQAVQHAFREGRPVALAAAGLPGAVSDLLDDDVLTFLRRAERFDLGHVDAREVARALRTPIETGGRSISDDALDTAVAATRGYPFLIQLVGHQTWRVDPTTHEIDETAVGVGVDRARKRVGRLVLEPSLRDLSQADRRFLGAMALDEGPSRMADVANRMGVTPGYASQYRLRLIAAEVIETAGYGRVSFALPYLREHLSSQTGQLDGAAGRGA